MGAIVLASQREQQYAARRKVRKEAKQKDKGPARWERELSKGSPRITFLIGAVLTLPGASYLAGLDQIHNHNRNASTVAIVAIVLGFNLIMLWLLEVPLVGFLVAPEATRRTVDKAKAGLSEHGRSFIIRGLGVLGASATARPP